MSNSVTEKIPAVMWMHIGHKWFWKECMIIPLSFFSGNLVLKDDDENEHKVPTLEKLDPHVDAEWLLPIFHEHAEVDELAMDYWNPVEKIDEKWQITQHIVTTEKCVKSIFGSTT